MKAKNPADSSPPHAAKGKPDRSTARAKKLDFGEEIRSRRSRYAQQDEAEISASVWDQFRKAEQLRLTNNVSKAEMKMLSQLVGCNFAGIRSLPDLIFMLNTIRHAVGR